MKNIISKSLLNLLPSLVILFALSCSTNSNDDAKTKQLSDAKAKVDSINTQFENLKREYAQQFKEKLIEADKNIEELNKQLNNAKGKLKAKIEAEIVERQERQRKLKEIWSKIGNATKENWNNFEQDLKNALQTKNDSIKIN